MPENSNGATPEVEKATQAAPSSTPFDVLEQLAEAGFHRIPDEVQTLLGQAIIGRTLAESALKKAGGEIERLTKEVQRLTSDVSVLQARLSEFEGDASFPEPGGQTEPTTPEAEATA